MTPEQLKASILQYAIQGKLVEQRPEEGTADELYLLIQEEKQRLIKEGKIKKEKPLAEIIDEEIPFEIPESWKWVRLRNLCTKIVDGDHNPPSGVNYKTDYLMLSATNINNDTIIDLDKVRYLENTVFEKENLRTNVMYNDILFTIVGSMGRSCVYKGGLNICFQRSVAVLSTLIYPEYLKRVLDTPYIQNYMYTNASGTAQKGFYLKQVDNLLIALPPLEEQKRIVSKLEELFPYIERYARAYEKLEQFNAKFPEDMKKSILQYAIQGKLVEQRPEDGTAEELYQQIQEEKQKLIKEGTIKKEKPLAEITEDEIPFDIPDSWTWVKLGTLFVIERGSSPRPIKNFLTKQDDGVNWIKIGDSEVGAKYITSTSEKITKEGAQKSRKVNIGDFIISNSMSFGRPYIMAIEGYVHDGWNILHFLKNEDENELLDKNYIYYILSSNLLKQQITAKAAGGVVLNIRSDNLKELIVPIPPLKEQKRIVSKIEELLPYCDRLNK